MIDATAAGADGIKHAMLRYRSPQEHAEVCAEFAKGVHAVVLIAGTRKHLSAIRSRFGAHEAG